MVLREHLRFVGKYERYERRRTQMAAHNPPCISARTGDRVVVAECRPLSKTKKFVVVHRLGEAADAAEAQPPAAPAPAPQPQETEPEPPEPEAEEPPAPEAEPEPGEGRPKGARKGEKRETKREAKKETKAPKRAKRRGKS